MATMVKNPGGEELVLLTRAEYDRLVETREDADDAAQATDIIHRIDAGEVEMLSSADMDALLAAASPLEFWRKKRGLTQIALAEAAGLSQAEVSILERGHRSGNSANLARLAKALRVGIADLVIETSGD